MQYIIYECLFASYYRLECPKFTNGLNSENSQQKLHHTCDQNAGFDVPIACKFTSDCLCNRVDIDNISARDNKLRSNQNLAISDSCEKIYLYSLDSGEIRVEDAWQKTYHLSKWLYHYKWCFNELHSEWSQWTTSWCIETSTKEASTDAFWRMVVCLSSEAEVATWSRCYWCWGPEAIMQCQEYRTRVPNSNPIGRVDGL